MEIGLHLVKTSDCIDEKTGTVQVYKLLPNPGDSIMIVNCGDHFEVRYHHWEEHPVELTLQEIEDLKRGHIIWN